MRYKRNEYYDTWIVAFNVIYLFHDSLQMLHSLVEQMMPITSIFLGQQDSYVWQSNSHAQQWDTKMKKEKQKHQTENKEMINILGILLINIWVFSNKSISFVTYILWYLPIIQILSVTCDRQTSAKFCKIVKWWQEFCQCKL